jgi:hypothetical protein
MYHRTHEQRQGDLARAKPFEKDVLKALGPAPVRDLTASTEELDFCIPGIAIEVKAKFQPIGARWLKHTNVPEPDLFILDELSLRKACKWFPNAWIVIGDMPQNRLFLASISELVAVERQRVNRVAKGKLLMDLRNFRQLSSLDELLPQIQHDLDDATWKKSNPLGLLEVPQV